MTSKEKLEDYLTLVKSTTKKEKKPEEEEDETGNESENNPVNKEALKYIEEDLKLYLMPSFNEIYEKLDHNCLKLLISNIQSIICSKKIDDQKRAELITKLAKVETEKKIIENENTKLKNSIIQLEKNIKEMDQNQKDEKSKAQDTMTKLKIEKEKCSVEINKLKGRIEQYQNEINKKALIIHEQGEQIKKLNEKHIKNSTSVFNTNLMPAINSEIYLSYQLPDNGKKGSSENTRQEFYEDYKKSLENKYDKIIKDNELMKKSYTLISDKIMELAKMKKESFMKTYQLTFGVQFINKKNIDLSIENSFDVNKNLELFLENLTTTVVKLKEFMLRTDELLQNYSVIPFSRGENNEKGGNNEDEKISCINPKYYSNCFTIFAYYEFIANELANILKCVINVETLKINEKENLLEECKNCIEIAINNILECLKQNKQIEGFDARELKKIKPKELLKVNGQNSTNEKSNYGRLNYDALDKEINDFVGIMNNMQSYFDTVKIKEEVQSKTQEVPNDIEMKDA